MSFDTIMGIVRTAIDESIPWPIKFTLPKVAFWKPEITITRDGFDEKIWPYVVKIGQGIYDRVAK